MLIEQQARVRACRRRKPEPRIGISRPLAKNGLRYRHGAVIPEVATELAAIADEALKNVAQHARATAVDVSLSYLREALTLIVKDDGVGFDSASGPPAGHFGLIGMAERADCIKGSLTVTARVGEGTTVSVVVPGRRAYPIRTISDRLRGLLPLPA